MLDSGYEEVVKVDDEGEVLLYVRNGIFQARIYKGERSYLYRSLKTKDLAEARKRATRLWHDIRVRTETGLPITQTTMSQVIDEYVAMRQKDHEQSLLAKAPTSNERHTSDHMLRQIKRVVKFWRDYCGSTTVDRVDDAVLRAYIPWRKDFYHRMPLAQRPRNYKLNPTDKTLQWEFAMGKALVRYAHEQGYRGKMQLPIATYTAKKKIVRPAFSRSEFAKLLGALRDWVKDTDSEKYRYSRLLLQNYVLILSDTGMRVGEANNLKWGDLTKIKDGKGRDNYEIRVKGKTGARTVVGRTNVFGYFERLNKLRPNHESSDYIFRMKNGSKVITLIDQFQNVLEQANLTTNRDGERYTLYSLRHFYATRFLRDGKPIFDIARNMGTSVEIIQTYYGKHATALDMATRLGS